MDALVDVDVVVAVIVDVVVAVIVDVVVAVIVDVVVAVIVDVVVAVIVAVSVDVSVVVDVIDGRAHAHVYDRERVLLTSLASAAPGPSAPSSAASERS